MDEQNNLQFRQNKNSRRKEKSNLSIDMDEQNNL